MIGSKSNDTLLKDSTPKKKKKKMSSSDTLSELCDETREEEPDSLAKELLSLEIDPKSFAQKPDVKPFYVGRAGPPRSVIYGKSTLKPQPDIDYKNVYHRKYIPRDDGSFYFGDYDSDGQPHGTGVLEYANGNSYRGQFHHGARQGQGLLTLPRKNMPAALEAPLGGSPNQKEQKDNLFTRSLNQSEENKVMERSGKLAPIKNSSSRSLTINTDFNDDQPTTPSTKEANDDLSPSKGILKNTSSTDELSLSATGTSIATTATALEYAGDEYYEGSWYNDKKNGAGRYKFFSGSLYEGEYQDDKFHGKGVYTFANKACYDGEFSAGKQHGKGIFKWPSGATYDGTWPSSFPFPLRYCHDDAHAYTNTTTLLFASILPWDSSSPYCLCFPLSTL
jgi:hypothetical protein